MTFQGKFIIIFILIPFKEFNMQIYCTDVAVAKVTDPPLFTKINSKLSFIHPMWVIPASILSHILLSSKPNLNKTLFFMQQNCRTAEIRLVISLPFVFYFVFSFPTSIPCPMFWASIFKTMQQSLA